MIAEDDRYSKTDVSFSMGQATAVAVGLTPIIAVVVLGAYYLIWGTDSLLAATSHFRHLEILIPILLVSIVVHEGLHWMGYVGFGHLSWKTLRFGFNVRSLAAYVHSNSPVSISAYRRLVVLPGIVLGVVPACIGIGGEVGWITLYGFLILIGASGDLAILWKIRRVSPDSLVVDHPSRAGCWVFAKTADGDFQSTGTQKQIPG